MEVTVTVVLNRVLTLHVHQMKRKTRAAQVTFNNTCELKERELSFYPWKMKSRSWAQSFEISTERKQLRAWKSKTKLLAGNSPWFWVQFSTLWTSVLHSASGFPTQGASFHLTIGRSLQGVGWGWWGGKHKGSLLLLSSPWFRIDKSKYKFCLLSWHVEWENSDHSNS